MTDEELIAMARLAQRDDRMSTGALYGNLADRIEALIKEVERNAAIAIRSMERATLAEQWRDHDKASAERFAEALHQIAAEASVTVKVSQGDGIDWNGMYKAWRKIATTRIDIARAALTATAVDDSQTANTAVKAEADRIAALDEIARLGQEFDAETEAGGSIIQGLREAAEYTKSMLKEGGK